MRLFVAIAVLISFHFSASAQTTWYVPDDFSTIQGAISDGSVLNGDIVNVRPGTYVENINFLGKAITVRSELGPESTTIDGYKKGPVTTFESGEGLDSVLDGFTLTNGRGARNFYGDKSGGGIFCHGSSPTIRGNFILENTADRGGGIACEVNSSPVIRHNTLSDNTAFAGGGILAEMGCHVLIENNHIRNNEAVSSGHIYNTGGGIRVFWESTAVIRYNIIEKNRAVGGGGGIHIGYNTGSSIYGNRISHNEIWRNGGGGIYLESGTHMYGTYSHVFNNLIHDNSMGETYKYNGGGGICSYYDTSQIYNNTILNNEAYRGAGLYVLNDYDMKPLVANCIFWDNQGTVGTQIYAEPDFESTVEVRYCDVMGGYTGEKNIDLNPRFAEPERADYHLTFLSPCKDKGDDSIVTATEDFEGDPRIAYDQVDMGADEFHDHLYYIGNATPGGDILVKIVGTPGKPINCIILGGNLLDPPLQSDFGLWYIANPIQIIISLGTLPSSGVSVFPGTLPTIPQVPYTLYMQSAIDYVLTNLCTVQVQ